MKRFICDEDRSCEYEVSAIMREDSDGPYVLFNAAQSELAALREELAEVRNAVPNSTLELVGLRKSLAAAEQRNAPMRDALLKIIEMNRQQAKDQYGDAEKAESWSCIVIARAALKPTESGASE